MKFYKTITGRALMLLLSVVLINPLFAQEGSEPEEEGSIKGDYLTSDWGGARQKMVDNGVNFELVYTAEGNYNFTGGIATGFAYLGNLDITLGFDMEKLVGWTGGEFFFYGLSNHGSMPLTELVGDAQVSSNIEAGENYIKLYEAWFQQSLFGGKVALLLGLHDLNSEFYANDAAGLFFNSSQGIGGEAAQTGSNGPSIFPATAPAIRLMVAPTDELYISFATYNAIAGNPDNVGATYADFTFAEGVLMIGELGYYKEGSMKLAAGGWGYSMQLPDLVTGADKTPFGIYAIAEKTFGEYFSLFVRWGMANQEVYEISMNIAEGFALSGALWGRDDDQLGLAATTVTLGSGIQTAAKAAGLTLDQAETSIELTYRLQVTPWFGVQPDFQYILNPGFDSSLNDAFVGSLRVDLSF